MSAGDCDCHFNQAAVEELEKQAREGKGVLERLAAQAAAADQQRAPRLAGLVEAKHVRRAANRLFGFASCIAFANQGQVFLSSSQDDMAFVKELPERLSRVSVSCFVADLDIQPSKDWEKVLLQAIHACRVFVPIITPRFLNSQWLYLELGAALAAQKPILPVVCFVNRENLPAPLDRFEAMVVENGTQRSQLVEILRRMCSEE